MKSKVVRFLTLCIVLSLVLTLIVACGKGGEVDKPGNGDEKPSNGDKDPSNGDETEIDYWGRYEKPVTVRLVVNGSDEGFSWEDNIWTKAWEEKFNIKTEIMWNTGTTDAFETKFAMAMLTGDLPDYMFVNSAQFRQLIESDYAADITKAYDYIYPFLKETVFEFDGPEAQDIGIVDGVRYGLAKGGATGSMGKRLVFIRRDYMEAVNASAPTTVEELVALGKKFVDEGLAKYALPLLSKVVGEGYSDIIAVANGYGVQPTIWVDDGKGGMSYGSIAPAMETVLDLYKDLFNNNYIDSTFATAVGDDFTEQIMNGEIGILTGEVWIPTWPLPDLKDENGDVVDWVILPPLPSESNTNFKVQANGSPADTEFAVVRKGFEHPEAIMKLLNHKASMLDDPEFAITEFHTAVDENGEKIANHMRCPIREYFNFAHTNIMTYVAVTDAIDNGNMDALVRPHDQQQYDNITKYLKAVEDGDQEAANAGWAMAKLFYGEQSGYGSFYPNWNGGKYIYDMLNKRTENYDRLWGTMEQYENTFYVNYIGSTEDTTFSQFVKEWNDMGGELLTYELNH